MVSLKNQLSTASRLAHEINKELEDKIERALASIYSAGKEAPSQDQRNNVATPLKREHEARIVSSKNRFTRIY